MHQPLTEEALLSQFRAIQEDSEDIFWADKPHLGPFLFSGVSFLIFGLLWFSFDYFLFIRNIHHMKTSGDFPVVAFFAFHLMPFWLSLLNMVRLIVVYKNVYYAMTNKRVIFRGGFWGIEYESIDYDKIQDIQVTVNLVENLCGAGTIRFYSGKFNSKGGTLSDNFIGISEPYEVYKKVKEVSVNIKTDWNYPNALRPGENPGYQTKYVGKK